MGLAAVVAALSGCGPLPPEAVQQLQQGQHRYEAGEYVEAVKALDAFLAGWGGTDAAAEAHYIRGQSYLKLGQPKRCRADLERALTRCKRPDLRARVHVALGSMDWEAGRRSVVVMHWWAVWRCVGRVSGRRRCWGCRHRERHAGRPGCPASSVAR